MPKNPTFRAALDVVATLRDEQIQAAVTEQAKHDALTDAMEQALKSGVDINDLSEASGLPVERIRERIERRLTPTD